MEKRGLIFVFLTAVISGLAIFLNKIGVGGINPSVFTFSKNILVFALLLVTIIGLKEFKQIKSLKKKEWGFLSVIGLLGGSIPFLLFFKGLSITTGIKGAFIHKTMFVYVAILSIIFFKEKLNKQTIFVGATLLIGNILLLRLSWQTLNLGDLLIFLATVCWAGETILSKKILKTVQPKIVALGRMGFGSMFILGYLFAAGEIREVLMMNYEQILWIIITSIFLLGYVWTWYTGLQKVSATVATCILMFGSIITSLLNLIFLDNILNINQIIGVMFIGVGIISVIFLEKQIITNKNSNLKFNSIN
ncbi:DMT family transporter [Candidatus Woesearchaeota archaeon]|jgi:drug/metabolite transporter (DMT)-like permease|nr:DMT family transporter [Candidatus Woesearchaeota archaeon]